MRVLVERSSVGKRNRIYLKCPWQEGISAKCKAIPGASPLFDAAGKFKFWSYPLDLGTCAQLRRVFRDALVIGPELWAWGKAQVAEEKALRALLAAPYADLPRVRAQEPQLWRAMQTRPFQTVAAAFAARTRRAIIGDDPGLGKTVETFGAVVESGIESGPVLVFCPSTAIESTWMKAIWRFMPEDDVITTVGTRAQRMQAFNELEEVASTTGRRTWVLCNIEMARIKFDASCPGDPKDNSDACDGEFVGCKFKKRHKVTVDENWGPLFAREWQAVILDESHEVLAGKKSRKQKQSQQRAGFSMLPIVEYGLKLALSGTPWRGKPENFWGTLNWLRPDVDSGFWRWAELYFDVSSNGFGNVIGKVKPEREADWKRMLDTVMIRRTKAEVAKDLPPKQYVGERLDPNDEDSPIGIWLPMTAAQQRAYWKFQDNCLVRLEGGTLYGKGILSELTRLQQFATSTGIMVPFGEPDEFGQRELRFDPTLPSNKMEWLLQFLDERDITKNNYGHSKVVVASRATPILKLFRAELQQRGIWSHLLVGDVPLPERTRQIAEFQGKGGPRVFFLNKRAGGTSITLDAADDLVLLERHYNPDIDTQVEDRIHRISRQHQVRIYRLGSAGTVEEDISNTAEGKDSIQRHLMDGLRGVEFAKKLFAGRRP